MSRSAFEDVVDEAMADDEYRSTGERRIGLYTVGHVHRRGRSVLFDVPAGGFIDGGGSAYLPGGPSPALERAFDRPRFRHLDGPWYTFVARF